MLILSLLFAVQSAPRIVGFLHQQPIVRRTRYIRCGSVSVAAAPEEPSPKQRPLTSSTRERTVVILYHKPANVVTSHSNADEVSRSATAPRRTVYEDIMSMRGFVDSSEERGAATRSFAEVTGIRSKLHAIGRLDADTTGLLLLTNDGALVHRITNPKTNAGHALSDATPIQKTYEALIMGHHTLPDPTTQQSTSIAYTQYPLQQLLDEGVTLSAKHGGQTRPVDALSILSHPTRSTTRVQVTISEGKNRQIRRMFHAVGSGVMQLHRASVGNLSLSGLMADKRDSLSEGQWRVLSEEEVEQGLGWQCRNLDIHRDEEKPPRIKRRTNNRRHNRDRRKKGGGRNDNHRR